MEILMVLGYRLIVVICCVIFSVIAYTDAVEVESAEAVKPAKPTPLLRPHGRTRKPMT
jgi:hypothetical protein